MKKESLKQTIQQGFAGLFHICKQELKAVFKDQGVLIFFLLVPLAYPLVYAFIYTNEVVREVPVAVIDNSNTALSRQFIRTVDASADVHIQSHCADMEEGKNLLKETRYMAFSTFRKASVKTFPPENKLQSVFIVT